MSPLAADRPTVKAGVLTAPVLDVFLSRQGEGVCVGDEHIFIRFGGCNLSCDYCDTPESIPAGAGWLQTGDAIVDRVAQLSGGRPLTVSLTGGEPLLHARFLEELIPALKARGHRIYLETNGTLPRAVAAVADSCDWIAMDIKPATAIGRNLWEAHRWFLETAGPNLFVKLVLTAKTTAEELERAITLIASVNSAIPLILQPATPWAETASVPLERLASWWAMAAQRLKDVRVVPQIHRLWDIP